MDDEDSIGKISFYNNSSKKLNADSLFEDVPQESIQLLPEDRLKTEEKSKIEYGLNQVNFEVNPGELVMIIGNVGSGKSSLLLHLLSEIDNSNFNITAAGNISYYSEDP